MFELSNELKYRAMRRKVHDDKYSIVGVEIKNRRMNSLQTLEALSQDVCSVSYLCKVEQNKIEPNKAFLRELCSRLELSDDKVDYLFELRDVIIEMIHAYVIGDVSFIDMCCEHGNGFENYRFKIMLLINNLAKRDFDLAYDNMMNLMPLLSNMGNFDLAIFSMFSAITLFYRFSFKEALDCLMYLDDFNICDDIKVLKGVMIFKLHFALNKSDTPYWYDKAKMLLFEHGYYNMIDELKYALCLYYIKNDCVDTYELIKNRITNRIDRNSLDGINAVMNDNNLTGLLNFSDNELNEFAKTLKMVINEPKSIENLLANKPNYYVIGFDYVLLEYLSFESYKDRLDYIFKVGLPNAYACGDDYLKRYFIREVARMPIHIRKNRAIVRAFILAYGKDFSIVDAEVFKYDDEEDKIY